MQRVSLLVMACLACSLPTKGRQSVCSSFAIIFINIIHVNLSLLHTFAVDSKQADVLLEIRLSMFGPRTVHPLRITHTHTHIDTYEYKTYNTLRTSF